MPQILKICSHDKSANRAITDKVSSESSWCFVYNTGLIGLPWLSNNIFVVVKQPFLTFLSLASPLLHALVVMVWVDNILNFSLLPLQLLFALTKLGPTLDDYLYLIVPSIVKLFESSEMSMEIRK